MFGFRIRACHPLWSSFPRASPIRPSPTSGSRYPTRQAGWFGLFPFRSPLLRESLLFSFPPGTEMFHFPGLATKPYFIQTPSTGHYPRWVFPFGHLRIKAYLPLPEAYRSKPRPSSPAGAKASIVCPYTLDRIRDHRSRPARLQLHTQNYAIVKELCAAAP